MGHLTPTQSDECGISAQTLSTKPIVADDEKLFALVVREAFNHRRKTLRAIFKNRRFCLRSQNPSLWHGDLIHWRVLETLSVQDFVTLSNGIAANGIAANGIAANG